MDYEQDSDVGKGIGERRRYISTPFPIYYHSPDTYRSDCLHHKILTPPIPNMSKDPYKTYEGGAGVADIAAAATCAPTAFPNPMGGIQNAQAAYHNHKFMKLVRFANVCP